MAVMLVTSVGELVIDLFTDQCPLATKNFLKLCKIKYYNNCLFHSVQKDFIVQTGDPTATGKGGDSIYKLLYGDQARFFDDEIHPTLKHDKVGIVAMASGGENANASQFYITTRSELDYLDAKHTVFGKVGEGLEALTRINEAFVDDNNRPYKNIRIKHTIILEDPFDDPTGLSDLIPNQSPELKPPTEGEEVRFEDDWVPMDETMDPEEIEKSIRKGEAQSRAVVLEMIGDLPEADMKPPKNVLFVCKLNPVTEEGDLELIFGRFGKVKSADIIRDFKSGDSLCFGFIEFETEEACEAAYFKMDDVLIDDRQIHVDFSQSVSYLWNRYRKQGKTGGDGQSGKGCFKCGEVGHFAKECPNDGAEQKEAPTEKPKYTIKDTGGQRGHANKRYEMVFADDENPQDQRISNKSRQGRRQDKDRDSHHGSEHHRRMERELERPRADRDENRRTERESERSRVDMDVRSRKMQNGNNGKNAKRPAPTDQQDGDERKPKKKRDLAESELRRSIDMCSKFADVMGAIDIYDRVVTEGKTSFNQYSYNVLLYLCSSGATGSLKRGKSGNSEKHKSNVQGKQTSSTKYELKGAASPELKAEQEVELTNDQKEVCLQRGFAVYEAMKQQGVPPNEATFTAIARLAVAKEDGDLAFDMVKQMAVAKLSPRLRSYNPALHTYCKLKNVEKAFEVDEHMQSAGVRPEESELEALLTLSVGAGLEDKVYSILLRIRTTVRGLSPSTIGVIKLWFESSTGGNVGSSNWDTLPSQETVKAAYDSRGGGWHGLGWLGRGPWEVKSSVLDASGVCQECGEQLVTVDIDPKETELFANSLSELACQRESKNNEFKKFQGWLDRHGPFDVIVDGANVGLFNQNFGEGGFNFHQLNSVVEGIKEKVGSKREPLVLLHHRRTRGGSANSPFAITTLKRWQDAHALYTTPTGSNDDWYWLYAAVRYKCILVTNDEMRDHLFQLLGSDFFPKWKERHQVRFSLSKEGPVFHMPPPYSILIQESVSGSWHIPKSCNDDVSSSREWSCITRTGHTSPEIVKVEEKLNCLLTGAEEIGTDAS